MDENVDLIFVYENVDILIFVHIIVDVYEHSAQFAQKTSLQDSRQPPENIEHTSEHSIVLVDVVVFVVVVVGTTGH